MRNFIRRFFKKDTERSNVPVTSAELLKMTSEVLDALVRLSSNDISKSNFTNNGLVDRAVLDSKIAEMAQSYKQAQFHLDSFSTHLRCLHNWLTTPPSRPKVAETMEEEPELAKEDTEFLEKLREAQNAQGN